MGVIYPKQAIGMISCILRDDRLAAMAYRIWKEKSVSIIEACDLAKNAANKGTQADHRGHGGLPPR